MKSSALFHQIYFKTTGYSFTHMARLFLRLFIGLMIAQFGVRQLIGEPLPESSFAIPYLATGLHLWLVIIIEIICPFFIMVGLFTRIMIIPPFILMLVSSHAIFIQYGYSGIDNIQLLCIPFLFMGVFLFMLLGGPGKISFDYFYSLYLINRQKGEEADLEEV